MLFRKLRYSKIEGTIKIIQHTDVSYQAAEKINVEMEDLPQCRGRLNAKNWFSPILVSVRTVMPNTS